jgi:FAD/FMN-containing dehydrogenase
MARAIDSDAAAFSGQVAGTVLSPEDPGYDAARSVWNGDIDHRPAAIVQVTGPADVAAAVEFGRDHDLEISVRGGGHSFAGYAVADRGLMIDLSRLCAVSVDPDARRAICGGGATWADVDGATQAHALAVPGGTVSHTGIGGLTLGGGFGWLTARAGLTCDNLVAAEVVTADGRVLRASAGEHPDLFWALRGGGGNFGVVTAFEYRLHQVDPLVHMGLFFWGLERVAEALRFLRDFARAMPQDMGFLVVGVNAPAAPFVPEEHHLAPGCVVLVCGFGSQEEHERAIQPIRADGRPLFELVTPIPYTDFQKVLDAGAPWGIRGYEKAVYVDDLSDDVIAVTAEHLPRKQSPMSFFPVQRLNGAFGRVGEDETAFGGARTDCYAFSIAAMAPTPEALQADRAWVRSFWEDLRPYAKGAGSYVNFMTEYDEDRVRASYGRAKYERLAAIKATYDPNNVFHLNANIRPA